MFDDFEKTDFPVKSCTKKNPREKGLMDSDDLFLCVVVDRRWPDECKLMHLRPYTAKDGKKLLYGWAETNTDGYIDHYVNSIHGDDQRVVAWKRVEKPEQFGPSKWEE